MSYQRVWDAATDVVLGYFDDDATLCPFFTLPSPSTSRVSATLDGCLHLFTVCLMIREKKVRKERHVSTTRSKIRYSQEFSIPREFPWNFLNKIIPYFVIPLTEFHKEDLIIKSTIL